MADWYLNTAAGGTNTGGSWVNAFNSTTALATAFAAMAAGDTLWVNSSSAELDSTANKAYTSPGTAAAPCRIISVNTTTNAPPLTGDYLAGASFTTTTSHTMSFAGYAYYCGCIFKR